ncbi:MAG: HlyD family secretion protein, partial [Terriglobales bacterium]
MATVLDKKAVLPSESPARPPEMPITKPDNLPGSAGKPEMPEFAKPSKSLSPQKPPIGRPAKKTFAMAILALVVAGACVGGWMWWQRASRVETTDDAYVTAHVNTVSARIAGTVKNILVHENQEVKPGQLLVQIDPSDYQVAVEQQAAAVDYAQKQTDASRQVVSQTDMTAQAQDMQANGDVSTAKSSVEAAHSALASARADVARYEALAVEAKARMDNARNDAQRYGMLVQQGAVSRQQSDQARMTYTVAEADYQQAVQAISQAHSRVDQAQSQILQQLGQVMKARGGVQAAKATYEQAKVNEKNVQVSQSAIKKAQADLDAAKLKLSYTRITAAVPGKLGKRAVEVGQEVEVGQKLMAIVSGQPWIDANFKETQLGRVEVGDPVEIKIDAFGDRVFMGHVDSISPGSGAQFALLPPENATGNF